MSEHLEEEDALDNLKKPMRRFREEIEEIENTHWTDNDELIKWKLTYDVIEKNLGVWYALRYDVTVDPQIQRAVEILSDPAEYQAYLSRPEIGGDDEESADPVAAAADSLTSQ